MKKKPIFLSLGYKRSGQLAKANQAWAQRGLKKVS